MKRPSTEYIFLSLTTVFTLLLAYFFIPFSDSLKRSLFLVVAFLGLLFLVLGVRLIFRARKEKGKLRFFLMLTGISAILPLVGTLLHNFFYALAEKFTNYATIFEILHAGFFILSIVVAPILFLIGTIGSFLLLPQEKNRKKWIISIFAIFLAIVLSANLLITHETFESKSISIKYPKDYYVSEYTDRDSLIIIEDEEDGGERIEIYDTDQYDFDLIHGFSSSGLEEFESELVPKEKITKEHFEIWLFYNKDSIETKNTFHEIVESIKIK